VQNDNQRRSVSGNGDNWKSETGEFDICQANEDGNQKGYEEAQRNDGERSYLARMADDL